MGNKKKGFCWILLFFVSLSDELHSEVYDAYIKNVYIYIHTYICMYDRVMKNVIGRLNTRTIRDRVTRSNII